jgi:D-amino-acid dehydrogenase
MNHGRQAHSTWLHPVRMKVLIIGAGLIGVTSAYFLRSYGHEVTVIDRGQGPGLEASFANGALLTPSMAEPWNAPGCWRVLLASLGRQDAAMQLRLRSLPGLTRWAAQFLRQSSAGRFERNALSNLRVALHSRAVMQALRRETAIEYGRTARGALRIFRTAVAFDRGQSHVSHLAAHGLVAKALSRTQTLDIEPALAPIGDSFVGAIHYQTDETGDAHQFCLALSHLARQQGVEFLFGVEAQAVEAIAGKVSAVVSRRQRFIADCYVIAAGSYCTPLLRRVGIRLPVQPVKGYSVTFQCPESNALGIPIIDDKLHAAVVPLDGAIRVAGTAEFAGYDQLPNAARSQNLIGLFKEILPRAPINLQAPKMWSGLRAVSADGVPLIGYTAVKNLLVNTGHGHLGWTMAAGSGQLLAQLISGDSPSIDLKAYEPSRKI